MKYGFGIRIVCLLLETPACDPVSTGKQPISSMINGADNRCRSLTTRTDITKKQAGLLRHERLIKEQEVFSPPQN